jgi:hypothetical protein
MPGYKAVFLNKLFIITDCICLTSKIDKYGWGCKSVVEHLPGMNKALGLIYSTTKKKK